MHVPLRETEHKQLAPALLQQRGLHGKKFDNLERVKKPKLNKNTKIIGDYRNGKAKESVDSRY